MWKNICHYIFPSFLTKIETSSVLLKKKILYASHKSWNGKFLCLEKTFISCYLTLFMASKTKPASFHDLIRPLFLVLLLRFWLQNQNGKFLYLDKTFVFCSFAWFMDINFETGIFGVVIITLFLVLFLCLWLQKPTPEISITWQELCFLFLFMVFISNKGRFCNLTWCLFLFLRL